MSTTFMPAEVYAGRSTQDAGDRQQGRINRLPSLDIIRGAVMVLMAIDHVRVYAGVPPGGPTFGLFFTRWVTHFCAPAFIFLAGTAAYLHGQKLGSKAQLARYLLARGALLILLETTLLRFAWTFNVDYANFTFAGVIWVIGWCMILLAGLLWLPTAAIGAIGVAIIALHNLVDPFTQELARTLAEGSTGWLWQILYFGGSFRIAGDGPQVVVLYTIIPWVGVIAAGYAFGALMAGAGSGQQTEGLAGNENAAAKRRRRRCLQIGLGAIAAFVILRALDVYGDPRSWQSPGPGPAFIRFLNTSKYPASLLFLLMTLGPTISLIPMLDNTRGRVVRWLTVFGRVPFFYYVLHIPLIHVVALLISLVRTPDQTSWLVANHPMMPPPVPSGYMWSLALLYVVTALVVIVLYFPCRWFAGVKARRTGAWLTYL
jgi:uncharacterized membrane protein